MTEKRFRVIVKSNGAYAHQCWLNDSESRINGVYDEGYYFRDDIKGARMFCDLLNALHEDNQRLIRKNKRLHRDWDKLYDLCLDKGCTEDEIIKEMER